MFVLAHSKSENLKHGIILTYAYLFQILNMPKTLFWIEHMQYDFPRSRPNFNKDKRKRHSCNHSQMDWKISINWKSWSISFLVISSSYIVPQKWLFIKVLPKSQLYVHIGFNFFSFWYKTLLKLLIVVFTWY